MTALAKAIEAPTQGTDNIYTVSLDGFQGPMDLLLHLSIRQELDISQVCMSQVVDQYLSVIETKKAQNLNLDELSEYLVIAAELLSLKSKSLLPKPQQDCEIVEVQESFEELRERLRLYALCKKQAEEIQAMPQQGVDFFTRRVALDKREFRQNKFEMAPTFELAKSFAKLIKRVGGDLGRLKISLEPVSVVHFMMRAVDKLKVSVGKKLGLYSLVSEICAESESKVTARTGIITMFFGALELAKRGVLSVDQSAEVDEIQVQYKLDPDNVVKLDNFR